MEQRPSPLMMLATNTPGINQLVGTEYSDHYQRVVQRQIIDDSSLAYIARTDPADDPMSDPSCWIKSLPALDITFPEENVEIEVARARQMPAKRLSVLRLYFGVPVGSDGFWIDQDAWEGCQGIVDEAAMQDFPCYLAIDLSSRNDMTALAKVWKDPAGHLFVKLVYWKPQDTLAMAEIEDKAPYAAWVEANYLNATPGKTIGKEFVVAEVQKACLNHDVELMAFDPAFVVEFQQAAADINFDCYEWHPDKPAGSGLKMIRHAQGARGMHTDKTLWMPRSFQAMCDAILEKPRHLRILNPVTTLCQLCRLKPMHMAILGSQATFALTIIMASWRLVHGIGVGCTSQPTSYDSLELRRSWRRSGEPCGHHFPALPQLAGDRLYRLLLKKYARRIFAIDLHTEHPNTGSRVKQNREPS